MKKVLLASTALIAFGSVAAHAASPITISVHGFVEEWVDDANNKNSATYAANNTGLNDIGFTNHPANVAQRGEAALVFSGSSKFDNGITAGVTVVTNATQNVPETTAPYANAGGYAGSGYAPGNANVEQSYLYISGNFGKLSLGEQADTVVSAVTKAPEVGFGAGALGTTLEMVQPFAHSYFETFTNPVVYDDFSEKINYWTPNFQGFQAGITYVPNAGLSATGSAIQPGAKKFISVYDPSFVAGGDYNSPMWTGALTYKNKLGDVDVKGNLGYSHMDLADLSLYSAGLNLGMHGWTLGGSFLDRNVGSGCANGGAPLGVYSGVGTICGAQLKNAMHAGTSWDAGVKYATGPYAVSLTYIHDTTSGYNLFTGDYTGNSSTKSYALSGAYTMGPGVTWKNTLGYTEYDNGGSAADKTMGENKGVVLISGINVAF